MTDQELKDLVAGLSVAQEAAHRQFMQEIQALREMMAEQERQQAQRLEAQAQSLEAQAQSQAQRLEALTQQMEARARHSDAEYEKLRAMQAETARQMKETDRQLRRQMAELGRQIGGLGNKFGYFTEGMAFPAMEKLLRNKFKMDTIGLRVESTATDLEADVLAYSNGTRNEAIVVEIKSLLRERELKQVLELLEAFPRAFPEHANKRLYGIIAAVDASKDMQQRVLEQGLYLALIHDEQFKLRVPKDFSPKQFNPALA